MQYRVSIVLLLGVVAFSYTYDKDKDVNIKDQNQVVESKEEAVKDVIPLETKVTMVRKSGDNIELVFDLHEELNLNLQTGDDIFFRVVNKKNNDVLASQLTSFLDKDARGCEDYRSPRSDVCNENVRKLKAEGQVFDY